MGKVFINFNGEEQDPRWNYLNGSYPTTKERAREQWKEISIALSPESIAEDGELSSRQQDIKERGIHEDARLLYQQFKCPRDITSDGDIEQYWETEKVTTQFVTKADYVYKRKNGGTTLCYGTLEEDSNFVLACDNENLDGVWAERDHEKQKSWKDVCEHLEEVYDENIEQIETC